MFSRSGSESMTRSAFIVPSHAAWTGSRTIRNRVLVHDHRSSRRKSRVMARPYAMYNVPNYTTPNYSSQNPEDHLLEAIKYNDFETFKELVDTLPQGANTRFAKKSNQSALLAACFRGRTDMIEYLVVRGADCSYVNDFGWGAVKYCKQWYWNLKMYEEGQRIVGLLVKNGAEDIVEWRGGSQGVQTLRERKNNQDAF